MAAAAAAPAQPVADAPDLDAYHRIGEEGTARSQVIVMDAVRILRSLNIKRRTIRIALWTGEQQGALGSLSYVNRRVARLPRATTPAQLRIPEFMRARAGPPVRGPEHPRLWAVFTLDAGGGRIRGVSLAGNAALVPIFERWVAPLADLGMTMVGPRDDCGGDCRPFMEAGIPTPSFRQDPLEYGTRTHHTNMDTYERLVAADMPQAAVVVAAMLCNTAMRDELLPRRQPWRRARDPLNSVA
jgi:hypothetical protein